MKDPMSCSLTGYTWWKPFLVFFFISLALFIPLQNATNSLETITDPGIVLSTVFFVLILSGILSLVQAGFFMLLSRLAYPTITFRGKSFSFTGKPGEFISLMLVSTLLLIATLGIYLPWYYTRLVRYYIDHINYDGEPLVFRGKAGKLFKYTLLSFFLPVFVWAIVFGTVIAAASIYETNNFPDIANSLYILAGVVYLFLIIIIIPFLYYFYKWCIDFSWKNIRVYWKTDFWKSFFFLVGQILLSIITLGIYMPAAILSCWKFFTDRTVLEKDGQAAGRLDFTREQGGFGFMWKQIALSVITLGIYLPWAYANMIKYFIDHCSVETTPAELPQNY